MESDAVKRGLFRGKPLYIVTALVLLIALPLSILAAVTFGTMRLPMGEVYRVIRFELGSTFLRLPIPEEWAPGTPIHVADPPAQAGTGGGGGRGSVHQRRGHAGHR